LNLIDLKQFPCLLMSDVTIFPVYFGLFWFILVYFGLFWFILVYFGFLFCGAYGYRDALLYDGKMP
jgi:hypothetical protein